MPNASEERFFLQEKGTGAYTSLHTWCIFGIIMMDGAPPKSCMFLLFMVHPPNVVVEDINAVFYFQIQAPTDWNLVTPVEMNAYCITCLSCNILGGRRRHQETRPQWAKGLHLMAFSFSADLFFLCLSTTCQGHQTWAWKNIAWKLICVFFESFVKFIDLNYGALLYSFNITIMLFSPHV